MTKLFIAVIALLGVLTPVQAHQIWIEQSEEGQNAVVRFGEFGENLREVSPGLLDKFAKVTGTIISAKGEQKSDATKTANGFTLPFKAADGDSIVAEDAGYPLYTWKQQDKQVINWFYPAARFITGFAAQQPRLVLDLVPTGQDGQFKLTFKNEPKAKTKVTLVTESGWSKEGHTDEQGLVKFDMPWKGVYVAEVSFNDRSPGERTGTNGAEKYDAVSYATTVTYVNANGLTPIPAGPPKTPGK
ncbi:cobalt ABC transporter substrate-binding protein [Bradyrhizobium sp. LHD-71]|uniref:cobalt ABC transporter substrate-binding protein n=1 Tax=Bradyrhizobium sp. LHD-71 TaxID=3072141 RepID=UPI00280D0826|nr:cobalt ABC transporter substrate-binding protein [Bradyrhizobium sp. LHD-71]MDQ8730069.1 cobalt ABC transporter substrate-binding protein [Bradyrhizobium sp. LHD-71]